LYTAKVGGDFMGLYRFILPIFPLGAVVLQEAMRAISQRMRPIVGEPMLVVAGLTLAIGFGLASAKVSTTAAVVALDNSDHGIDAPGYLKKYADDRIPVGRWLGQNARPDDLMTVGGAGVIPYYS